MPDQVNLLSIILDALGAFEGTIERGDRDWVSYPSDGDPEDILHQYLDDIERAKTVIAALMPGPRLTPKLRREIRKVLTEIERSAGGELNPDERKAVALIDGDERLAFFAAGCGSDDLEERLADEIERNDLDISVGRIDFVKVMNYFQNT